MLFLLLFSDRAVSQLVPNAVNGVVDGAGIASQLAGDVGGGHAGDVALPDGVLKGREGAGYAVAERLVVLLLAQALGGILPTVGGDGGEGVVVERFLGGTDLAQGRDESVFNADLGVKAKADLVLVGVVGEQGAVKSEVCLLPQVLFILGEDVRAAGAGDGEAVLDEWRVLSEQGVKGGLIALLGACQEREDIGGDIVELDGHGRLLSFGFLFCKRPPSWAHKRTPKMGQLLARLLAFS